MGKNKNNKMRATNLAVQAGPLEEYAAGPVEAYTTEVLTLGDEVLALEAELIDGHYVTLPRTARERHANAMQRGLIPQGTPYPMPDPVADGPDVAPAPEPVAAPLVAVPVAVPINKVIAQNKAKEKKARTTIVTATNTWRDGFLPSKVTEWELWAKKLIREKVRVEGGIPCQIDDDHDLAEMMCAAWKAGDPKRFREKHLIEMIPTFVV